MKWIMALVLVLAFCGSAVADNYTIYDDDGITQVRDSGDKYWVYEPDGDTYQIVKN